MPSTSSKENGVGLLAREPGRPHRALTDDYHDPT